MEISIIIPTLNRAASLKSTLRSILAQVDAPLFEVIVVDNGSTDNTREVCSETGKEISNFVYVYDSEPGLLTGRHKGGAIAQGVILSFIDDDVELNPYWLRGVSAAFREASHVSIVTGPCLPKYQVYPPAWLADCWQPTPHGGKMCLPLSLIDTGHERVEIDPLYAFGLNYSIRKEAFEILGGFHPDRIADHLQQYQGDGETGLSIKAKSKNYSALYVSSALLYHLVPQERLQINYFERWHYYSGVCHSFTDIRSTHSLYHPYEKNPSKSHLFLRIARKLNNLIRHMIIPERATPTSVVALQRRFNEMFQEGYRFHQQCFLRDEKVRDWVLRTDYWNYKLPI
ncbi:MAG: glycosyltransferase family 2 protein [Williamsia sp.]|nr:glycosyltransferase family 2 protein [Williamsia sp.]